MIKRFNLFFLTFFKIGEFKYAPGTFASLIACLLFFFLIKIFSYFFIFLLIIIIFFYSFIAINNSFDEFDDKDPKEIVIDEVVGQILTLLAIPIYETLYPLPNLYYFIAAFLLFRVFDILKPYPISYVDKNTTGAFGIMFDDILASIYSIIVLVLVLFYFGG
tara:strand:- start:14 stop:499 length:486 start_codon:yes stop_codon:yes gene_type:complete